ncbi:MAG: leucine-rich repeat domain-containing protein [Bacteroidales bacterium]|nr:leucine-rich repeat domain-containing protein [Bacteroidales bacterium]MBQ5890966.1 leucine-rich repeat domain-containing protein [Bacteroidales bacterium]
MKKTFAFLCSVLCMNILFSQSEITIGDLTYYISDKGDAIVKSCSYSATNVVILATITDSIGLTHQVVAIGNGAFSGCDNLTSVIIPNTIITIGSSAFWECVNLSNVIIPNSVTHIGEKAFFHCHSFTMISIPSSVIQIGDEAFYNCHSATTLNYNVEQHSDFNKQFEYCYFKTINIGDSVKRLPTKFAFNQDSLTTVNFSNNLKYISNSAFMSCDALTSITIPNSVDSIGGTSYVAVNGAFEKCSALSSVTIGENVKYIGDNTFCDCMNLETITCLATTPPDIEYSIQVFKQCEGATLYVPCQSIDIYANTPGWDFFGYSNIGMINFEVSVNSSNMDWGWVDIQEGCGYVILTANTNLCTRFVGWSDGNTENPRTIEITKDTNLTAIFSQIITEINASIIEGELYEEYGFCESEPGTYTQVLTDENGCDSLLVLNLTYQVSLNDVEEENINFYPNPTQNIINFSTTIEQIEVMDLTGKRLMSFNHENQINIEALPSGIYYLRLINDEKVTTKKVIKQ